MNFVERVKAAWEWRIKPWIDRFDRVQRGVHLARARFRRRRLRNTVFVGITGSAAKTTTKDLAVAVLALAGETKGNTGGRNHTDNVVSLVLSLRGSEKFCVAELAITKSSSPIDERIDLVRPSIAAFTIVGRDHIKDYGSLEAIAAEKGKVLEALPPDGIAVLNRDDPHVRRTGERVGRPCIWFGEAADADIRLVGSRSIFPDPLTLDVEYRGQRYRCVTGLHGTHLTVPVLAALGIGVAAGLPFEKCVEGVAHGQVTPGRMQVVACSDGVTFIRDDFKAPHWSFQAALDYLGDARAVRKVAVIGTLSDYSLSASKLYPKMARRILAIADVVVFVGPHALRALKARTADNQARLHGFTGIEEAHRFLSGELRSGDLVLLKGSNRVDHLIRLMLARSQPVSCWISDCGHVWFCDVCHRLYQPLRKHGEPSAGEVSAPVDAGPEAPAQGPASEGVLSTAWLVVGLGNHGEKYSGTPHNVGFEALDLLAHRWGVEWIPESDGMIGRTEFFGQAVVLFKSSTAINLTGPVVQRVRERLGIGYDHILVVHDDADLAIPDVRLKPKGSDGGHKGLRSLFSALRNDGFMPRIRIGIRAPQDREAATKSLVLQHFAPEDQPLMREGLEQAATRVEEFISGKARTTEVTAEPRRVD